MKSESHGEEEMKRERVTVGLAAATRGTGVSTRTLAMAALVREKRRNRTVDEREQREE